MPLQEMRGRALRNAAWRERMAGVVDHGAHALLIIDLPRDQDFQIVGEADQPTVEHPVHRSGKRNAVSENVRPVRCDRPYMRRLDLRATAAINQLEAGHRAALVVSLKHDTSEDAVPNDARRQGCDALALFLMEKGRLLLLKPIHHRLPDTRQQDVMLIEARFNDAAEVSRRKRSDGRLSAAGNPALLVQHAALHDAVRPAERHGIGKIEISTWLDDREIHARRAGIGNDLLDLSDGKIAARLPNLARLQIDDPVVDAGLDPTEILRRELIAFGRTVVVDRVGTVDEDGKGHTHQ